MRFIIHRRQVIKIQLGINLRAGQTRVPQQILHGTNIARRLQQMPSKAVAQHMRRNMLRAAVLLRPIIQPLGDLAAAQARAVLRGKQRGFVRLRGALCQPFSQPCHAALRERNLPLLIALAQHV